MKDKEVLEKAKLDAVRLVDGLFAVMGPLTDSRTQDFDAARGYCGR